ncbi:tetratricopeptide repeat protein [Aurantivibrio plasticivorans]
MNDRYLLHITNIPHHCIALVVFCLAGFIAGCSNAPIVVVEPPKPEILNAVMTPPPDIPESLLNTPAIELLQLTPGMRNVLRDQVGDVPSEDARLERLFTLLRYSPDFNIRYEADATLTAREVFSQRRGNCLAFSAMFVAMARELGLNANFQEVDVPPAWDAVTQSTLVQYRHVNVSVDLKRGGNGIIDFRVDRYSENYPQRIVSDQTALAHYYSNLSMDYLVAEDLQRAYVYANKAIGVAPDRGFIWNNMGIIQRRLGHMSLAEASYRHALQLDPDDWSALNNLAVIFEFQGDVVEAERLRGLAEDFKLRNPYYRFALAQQAYRKGEFQTVVEQMDIAIRRHSVEHRFYYLRGISLWELEERDAAIKSLRRAIKLGKADGASVGTTFLGEYEQQLSHWLADRG